MSQRWSLQLGRVFAAFMLLVLTVTQSGAALHHLTTRHVVCEQHGEFEHAGGHAAEPAVSLARMRAAGIGQGADLAAESAHAHCCVPLLGRYWVLDADAELVLVAPLRSGVLLPLQLSAQVGNRATQPYRFAPKTSPPLQV